MARKRTEEKRRRRRYTDEERQSVVQDAEQMGVCAAAREHGVHEANVSRWLAKARQQSKGRSNSARRRRSPGHPTRTVAAARPVRRPARRYTPSQKAEALEYAAKHSVTEAAERFGMTRGSLYDWQEQVERAAQGQGDAPTSGTAPDELEAQRDKEILAEYKRHPGLGPSQVRNQLRRKGVKVSVRTVRRVMVDAGYRPPKIKREPHDERFEAVRPNHCWHLDFVHRHIQRASVFTLILIDDHSRFVVGHGVSDTEQADVVIEAFEQAVERHGKPEMVIHDKGSAFWSWRGISRFTKLLVELGIDQIEAQHKEWNGKLEVFNANLHKELFNVQRFSSLAEMRRQLSDHLHWYNHTRTNHALGGLLVPADRFYGRAAEVLARIEAGGGRELSDGVQLRDRTLELFKLTSHDGVPTLWLMGKKVLELR